MAAPGLSESVTTVLRSRAKKMADNISKNNILLNRLEKKGGIKPVSGGRSIVQPLEYAENSTFKRYAGYELLNIQPSEVFSAAEFDWKQAAVAVSISGLEELMHAGPESLFDLLTSRMSNAERTFMNNLSADVYSDGTADGGKQIGGLQLLVPDDPTTGTVGGINRATWTFWRSVAFDATTDGGAAATSANIQSYMNRVWLQLIRGTDRPDLIVADNNYFRLYLESMQSVQRVTDDKLASAGFANLKFMDADVVYDGGYGGHAPTNHMYFLNTNYIHFRPHKDRNMVMMGPDRFSTNQDAMVRLIGWAGNMTLSNAFLQGVLKD
ncbi:MAG: phage major capsid protein [Magnetococcales bacterium]|nr:phage major capsid protein [Magnetococcales bacterium]